MLTSDSSIEISLALETFIASIVAYVPEVVAILTEVTLLKLIIEFVLLTDWSKLDDKTEYPATEVVVNGIV